MRNVLNILDLNTEEIDELISVAEDIAANPEKYEDKCQHKRLATLFFEPSTRTRLSFESAMLSLGGSVLGFAGVVEAVVYCGSAVTFGRSVRTVCSGVVTALLVETVTAGLDVVDLVVSGVELVTDSVSDSAGTSAVVSELSLKI